MSAASSEGEQEEQDTDQEQEQEPPDEPDINRALPWKVRLDWIYSIQHLTCDARASDWWQPGAMSIWLIIRKC